MIALTLGECVDQQLASLTVKLLRTLHVRHKVDATSLEMLMQTERQAISQLAEETAVFGDLQSFLGMIEARYSLYDANEVSISGGVA